MLKLEKRPKTPFWIARGTINGKRIERSTRCTAKKDAQRQLQTIIAEELASGGNAPASIDPTIREVILFYLAEKPQKRPARFLRIAEHIGGKHVSEATSSALEGWAKKMMPTHAPATVRRDLYVPLSSAITLYRKRHDRKPLDRQFDMPENSQGNERTVYAMPSQAQKIIEGIQLNDNGYLPAMVTTLIGTGVRMSEAIVIEGARDVFLEERVLRIPDSKNGEAREIRLIDRVVAALSRLPTVDLPGPLFRRLDGLPFAVRADGGGGHIDTQFAAAVRHAGLDPKMFTPHVMRHTWATWFWAQRKDVVALKAAGGWKSNQWQRYTKLGTPELAAAAIKAGWDFRESVDAGENRGTPTPLSPIVLKSAGGRL